VDLGVLAPYVIADPIVNSFITGGSGFVGGVLIRALKARGDRVVCLARSDKAEAAVRDAGADDVARGDLSDTDAMKAGMSGCDVVFHSAAVVTDWGDPKLFDAVNIEGTANTLQAARGAGVKRFVHVSTEAVLVGGKPLIDVDETRDYPKKPLGLYPRTKGAAERLVREANGDELTTVIMRPRFIWGAGDTTLLPQLIDAVETGKFRWVAGGHYLTSTCHVDNVVEGLLLGADKGKGGETYFLTDGEPQDFREFISAMLATQNVDAGAKKVPRWVVKASAWTLEGVWKLFRVKRPPPITRTAVRLVGEQVTVVDTKARDELGYRAKVTPAAGLAAMANS